jgi:hypothetical protein
MQCRGMILYILRAGLSWLIGTLQFNCLYRWHATTSQKDEQWTEGVFEKLFKGKPIEDVTYLDFKEAAEEQDNLLGDVQKWTFGKYVIILISD